MSNVIINPYTFAAYSAHAVHFDGTNDYLARGADLTGAADGKKGIISVWLRADASGDGTTRRLISTNTSLSHLHMQWQNDPPNNILRVTLRTSAPIDTGKVTTNTSWTSTDGWIHVLCAWDLGLATAADRMRLYINDADDEAAGGIELDNTIDYTEGEFFIGRQEAGENYWYGDMADLYINLSEHLDISSQANRRKFIDGSGKPVALGSDGSSPTGTAPIVCLNNATTTGWESNKGSGGGFTENGALTDASDSPSD